MEARRAPGLFLRRRGAAIFDLLVKSQVELVQIAGLGQAIWLNLNPVAGQRWLVQQLRDEPELARERLLRMNVSMTILLHPEWSEDQVREQALLFTNAFAELVETGALA